MVKDITLTVQRGEIVALMEDSLRPAAAGGRTMGARCERLLPTAVGRVMPLNQPACV